MKSVVSLLRGEMIKSSDKSLSCHAAFVSQCKGEWSSILSLLEAVSIDLVSHRDRDAEIRAFWLAMAQQEPEPDVSIAAMQWLVRDALEFHATATKGSFNTAADASTADSLVEQLARLQLTEVHGSIRVQISSSEGEASRAHRDIAAAQALSASAGASILSLSRGPLDAQRMAASQSALQLLQADPAPLGEPATQQSPEHEPAGAQQAASQKAFTGTSTGNSSAISACLEDDSTLVQLGQAAVAGLNDVCAEVAASWRQVIDVMAPTITRIATNASRAEAFLLLHEVRTRIQLYACSFILQPKCHTLIAKFCVMLHILAA